MILYFQTPPLKPGRTAAGFPFQESSNLWAPQSQPAAYELWGMCTSHTLGKQGSQPVAGGWSPAKNFQWLSYQSWNITGGGQLHGLWGEAGGKQ